MKYFVLLAVGILSLGCVSQGSGGGNASAVLSVTPGLSGGFSVASSLVKAGDVVFVDYIGTSDGIVFDTSLEAEAKKAGLPPRPSYAPLSFTVGAGQMIPGFDRAVVGMSVGQEKTAVLQPEDAYGKRDSRLILNVSSNRFGNATAPSVGAQVQGPGGKVGTITAISNQTITVDFNHFLAGKILTFKITLRKIGT